MLFRSNISDASVANPGGLGTGVIDENVGTSSSYPLVSNQGYYYASGAYVSVSSYLPTYTATTNL